MSLYVINKELNHYKMLSMNLKKIQIFMLKRSDPESDPDPEWLIRIRTRLSQEPVLWILIPWTDLGSCISSEADTDQGFWWPIIETKIQLKKYFFDPKLQFLCLKDFFKDAQATAFSPKKEHPAHQKKNLSTFFYFFRSFLSSWIRIPNSDPDPGTTLNLDSIPIRIHHTFKMFRIRLDPDPQHCVWYR